MSLQVFCDNQKIDFIEKLSEGGDEKAQQWAGSRTSTARASRPPFARTPVIRLAKSQRAFQAMLDEKFDIGRLLAFGG
jgi:hypothetical protein